MASQFTQAMIVGNSRLTPGIEHITWRCAWQGKFTLVGSVPVACCDPATGRPRAWDTEAEAETALLAAGVKRYQMADCTMREVV